MANLCNAFLVAADLTDANLSFTVLHGAVMPHELDSAASKLAK